MKMKPSLFVNGLQSVHLGHINKNPPALQLAIGGRDFVFQHFFKMKQFWDIFFIKKATVSERAVPETDTRQRVQFGNRRAHRLGGHSNFVCVVGGWGYKGGSHLQGSR